MLSTQAEEARKAANLYGPSIFCISPRVMAVRLETSLALSVFSFCGTPLRQTVYRGSLLCAATRLEKWLAQDR